MAVIEVSEDDLRFDAGDEVFSRAIGQADKITDLLVAGTLISATVDGVPVRARVYEDGFAGECGCAEDGLCTHTVSALLAWVRTGTDVEEADLLDLLRQQDTDWLASRLAALAANDPALTATLRAEAEDGDALDEAAELRADLDKELDALEESVSDLADSMGPYGEWYPDAEDLDELLEEAGDLLPGAPDAVREMADHVITRCERLLNYEICYGDGITEALEKAQDIHFEACEAGSPDVLALAERLVKGALDSGWGTFDGAPARYARVLGEKGLAKYRELLSAAPREKYGVDALWASLEQAEAELRLEAEGSAS